MKLTITDTAKKWGISRNTIYAKISTGELSRLDDKTLDISEVIRVFWEPKTQSKRSKDNTEERQETLKIQLLEQQVHFEKERREYAENQVNKLEKQILILNETIQELTKSIKKIEPPKQSFFRWFKKK